VSETIALPPTQLLRVLTYNILHPHYAIKHNTPQGLVQTASGPEGSPEGSPESGPASNWPQRQHQIAANIEAAQPDIILLQEVGAGALPPLSERYAHFPVSQPFQAAAVSGTLIAYDATRFFGVSQSVWTSANRQRSASRASLRDEVLGSSYDIISTHLEGYPPHEPDISKRLALVQAGDDELYGQLQIQNNWTGYRLQIIGGDYNMDPREHGSRAGLMAQFGYLAAPSRQVTEPAMGRALDHIYVKSFGVVALTQPEINWPYPDASDHLPRVLDISIPARTKVLANR